MAANRFPKHPKIRKMGTLQCDVAETTPLIWKDELYRFEVIRRPMLATHEILEGSWHDLPGDPALRFVHVRTDAPTPYFAQGHTFGFPFVDGDTMYVVTGKSKFGSSDGAGWGNDTLVFFRSKDLVNWEKYQEVEMPGWKIYNVNIAKMGDTYTLLIEISAPAEECGPVHFTFRFMQSKDLTNWTLTPWDHAFQRDVYCGSPSLYTFPGDEHYYVGYLEGYQNYRFASCIARSKDLVNWEYSPINPIMVYDDDDKLIANPHLTPAERGRIDGALNINLSDLEMCEYQGRTLIYYAWGDQKGTEFLAEACYEGPMHKFCRSFFEPNVD